MSNRQNEIKQTEKTDIQRRKALLGTAAGVSAVTVWHKPIIKSVVLPAHAAASDQLPESFYGTEINATEVTSIEPQRRFSPMDWLVPEAIAGVTPPPKPPAGCNGGVDCPDGVGWEVKATLSGTSAYQVTVLNTKKRTIRSGLLDVGGESGSLNVDADCVEGTPRNFNASIISVGENELVVQIDRSKEFGGYLQLPVPVGTGPDLETDCTPPG